MLLFLFICASMAAAPSGRRIFGGRTVSRKSVPWQVFVQERTPFGDQGGFTGGVCGGTIIGKNLVLTAAHCVSKPGAKDHVIIAMNRRSDVEDELYNEIAVKKFVHSGYAAGNGDSNFDLALLQLPKDFPLERGVVEIAPLASSNPAMGERCLQSGYGTTQARNNDPQLKMAYGKVKDCLFGSTSDGIICLSGKIDDSQTEGSICQGDSGGPLICEGELAGVVSATTAESMASNCRDTSAFTSVSHNAAWINSKLAELGVSRSQLGGQRVNMFPHGSNGQGGDSSPVVSNPAPRTPVVSDPVVRTPVVSDPVVRTPVVSDPVVRTPVVRSPVVRSPVVSDSRRPPLLEESQNRIPPRQEFFRRWPQGDPCGPPKGRGWKMSVTPLPSVSSMQVEVRESDVNFDVALGYAACLRLSYSQYREAKANIERATTGLSRRRNI
jgi:trypsin